MSKKKDYEVGKGMPSEEHHFPPSKSGDPKGRHKGSKNVQHVLSKILGEKITVSDAGKEMVVDNPESAMRVLVNKSFAGAPSS